MRNFIPYLFFNKNVSILLLPILHNIKDDDYDLKKYNINVSI